VKKKQWVSEAEKARQKTERADAREREYIKWRAGLKPGSLSYEGLERAWGNCLRRCDNLLELKTVWETIWWGTTEQLEMRARLKSIKDECKAKLLK
jgi:hypothetical protein